MVWIGNAGDTALRARHPQIDPGELDQLGADELRELTRILLERRDRDAQEISWRTAKIDKLTFEVAQLKRLQYGARASN